ncbi:MAG: peptidylprolyl isomerase [Alphaproteobacteria bacterium]
MKHYKIIFLTLLVVALSSCQGFQGLGSVSGKNSQNKDSQGGDSAGNSEDDPAQKIIATYSSDSSKNISLRDLNIELEKLALQNPKLKGLNFESLSYQQKESLIKELVLKEMAVNEAKNRGLHREKNYQEALRVFEREMLKQTLINQLSKEATAEKNVKKNYDELVVKLKDKQDFRISYIIVKSQNEAQVLYQALLKYPNSFAGQAQKRSLDKEIGKKGGDLGFVNEDLLPSEIIKEAKSLSKGQIAQPIQIGDKFAVVKLVDQRPAQIEPYEKAKDGLSQSLAKKAIENFLSQSLKKAKISILVK